MSPALDARGLTGIGGGIQLGVAELAGATADTLALVVITDGVENVAPLIADVAASITSTTYAIGIGRPTDVNTDALAAICQGHDGYLLVTGDLAGEELFRLHKYVLQVHAGVTNQQIVTDPAGELTLGEEHRIPFVLGRADISADAIVVCPLASVLAVRLEAPDGTVVDASAGLPTTQELQGDWLAGLRLTLPQSAASDPAGTWTAVLSIDRKRLAKLKDGEARDDAVHRRGALPYAFVVSARSDLSLRLKAWTKDARTEVVALLDAYGIPFWGDARALAVVTDPEGRRHEVALEPQGDGRFVAQLDVPSPGLYTARVVATGELDGQPFTREHTLSIPTVSARPSEGSKEPSARKRRSPAVRRAALKLATALEPARAPEPLPDPEVVSDEAQAMHRHSLHGGPGGHFPSEDDVPAPEPWEPAATARPKRKRAPKRPSGDPGHEH